MFQCGSVTLVACSLTSRLWGGLEISKGWWVVAWTSARPVTHLGGRILKFLFQMGLEGGAASTGVVSCCGQWFWLVCVGMEGRSV